jgi:hypothetical protein
LLNEYGLRNKIVAYVKNERANLNAMITTLKYVVNYEILGVENFFYGTCFGYAFSKVCQYRIAKETNCKIFKYVSTKAIQGKQEWNKTCIDYRIYSRKLNILLKARYILILNCFKVFKKN